MQEGTLGWGRGLGYVCGVQAPGGSLGVGKDAGLGRVRVRGIQQGGGAGDKRFGVQKGIQGASSAYHSCQEVATRSLWPLSAWVASEVAHAAHVPTGSAPLFPLVVVPGQGELRSQHSGKDSEQSLPGHSCAYRLK